MSASLIRRDSAFSLPLQVVVWLLRQLEPVTLRHETSSDRTDSVQLLRFDLDSADVQSSCQQDSQQTQLELAGQDDHGRYLCGVETDAVGDLVSVWCSGSIN